MNYLDKNGLSYFWEKIKSALSNKQDKLTAGANITIENNVISAAGGGTGGTSDYDSLTNRPKINNVTLTGNKTLNDLGIQPKGNYLTEHQDISGKQDKLNVITATLTSDKSITGTATTNDIALTLFNRIGSKLSLTNGEVVVNSGVNYVLVSGSVRITNDATSGTTAYNCYVYKNDEVVASSRMYGIGNGGSGACSTPSVLVSVSQGDIIKLAIWKASSNKCTVSSAGNATLLTVQSL